MLPAIGNMIGILIQTVARTFKVIAKAAGVGSVAQMKDFRLLFDHEQQV